MLSSVDIFYSIGIVSVSVAVAVEKLCSILLDREIRKTVSRVICRSTTPVVPMTAYTNTILNRTIQ